MNFNKNNYWAVILGGSSGFGLATAKKLSAHGMNICVLHRDRRGAMTRIEEEFANIRATDVSFKSFNTDALNADDRKQVLDEFSGIIGNGKVRLLMHSIAFGNLKLVAPQKISNQEPSTRALADKLGLAEHQVQEAVNTLFENGDMRFSELSTPPQYDNERMLDDEDLAHTIFAMGTSMLSWTKDIFARGLFAPDARIIGLTSEGNEVSWRGYAAVSAAKVALESVSRSIAREFAPHGIRSNIVQPGVTDTPALRLIPGSERLRARATMRNPFGRLTQVEDVANVIALLATDEAAWVNGSIIRVDGGERISG